MVFLSGGSWESAPGPILFALVCAVELPAGVMNTTASARWVTLTACVALSLISGCGDCGSDLVDRVETWVQDDPNRPGKVGTLRGLEVSQTAREVVDDTRRSGEGICDIDWQLDEPFAVQFSLLVTLEAPEIRRRWSEQGWWRRDEQGRWLLEADVDFVGDTTAEGRRSWQVYSDDDELWEWIGPDLAVRHQDAQTVRNHWKEEFSARFPTLMTLVSEQWRPEGGNQESWKPGGEPVHCGPQLPREQLDAWRPLIEARSDLQEARVGRGAPEGAEFGDDGESCRSFEAVYQVRSHQKLTIDYRECNHGEAPTKLERPDVDRVVDTERDRQRAQLAGELQQWIDQGLVKPVEEDEQ